MLIHISSLLQKPGKQNENASIAFGINIMKYCYLKSSSLKNVIKVQFCTPDSSIRINILNSNLTIHFGFKQGGSLGSEESYDDMRQLVGVRNNWSIRIRA